MAMIDILIPEGDPQQGILELPVGIAPSAPIDMLSDDDLEELILTGGAGTTGYGSG
jgi:hypothetical protein